MTEEIDARIPVVCLAPSAVKGAEIFNPTFWTGTSKGIIQSCWTEYSVLDHCVTQIISIVRDADRHCRKHLQLIQDQWKKENFDINKVIIFCQQPDLHMSIEAFFSGIKTLLDLMVQLLTSEGVVQKAIDGFHRNKNVYGGKVLSVLERNASKDRKETALNIIDLILRNKETWIDQSILVRDQFVHPQKGKHQLMFHIELFKKYSRLKLEKIIPPHIDDVPINQYTQKVLRLSYEFSSEFLSCLKNKDSCNV
jgi:hypothetical protein